MSTTGGILRKDNLTIFEKLGLISWPFLFLITLAAFIGLVSLYSAAGGSMDPWAGKQAIRFVVGMAGLIVVALIDIRFWLKLAYPLYVLCFILLIYVEAKGHIGMGAQRWINLGFITLQPSEVMKMAIILSLAKFFHGRSMEDTKDPLFLIPPLMIVLPPVGLVCIQPDLGTAVTTLMLAGLIFFMAGVSYWVFGAVIAVGAATLPLAWTFLHDYQKQRILVFFDPEKDPLGSGYHIIQSKIALGSGGIFGKGFLQGTQSRLNFLPEKQTDFIFALFTEEWGFVGSFCLLGLFMAIIYYGYFMALNCQNQFGRIVSLGVIANFFIYVFINVAMVMGIIPVVGIPLPLISYGGTVMLTMLFGFGLLMSSYVHRDTKFTRRGFGIAQG